MIWAYRFPTREKKKSSLGILTQKNIHGNSNNSCLYLQCKNRHDILVTKYVVINARTWGNNCMLLAFLFWTTNFYEFDYSDYKVELLDTYKYPFKIYHCNHLLKNKIMKEYVWSRNRMKQPHIPPDCTSQHPLQVKPVCSQNHNINNENQNRFCFLKSISLLKENLICSTKKFNSRKRTNVLSAPPCSRHSHALPHRSTPPWLGLEELKGLLQPKQFCDSVISVHHFLTGFALLYWKANTGAHQYAGFWSMRQPQGLANKEGIRHPCKDGKSNSRNYSRDHTRLQTNHITN